MVDYGELEAGGIRMCNFVLDHSDLGETEKGGGSGSIEDKGGGKILRT